MAKSQKIVGVRSLTTTLSRLRRQGKTIAFTNGCFDILHYGHIQYLRKAKNKDRILVLGLNSDKSIKKIKDPSRPIVPERERAEVLAALDCVDYITLFDEATPQSLIEKVKPDILIKGADWKGRDVVGSDVVKNRGGKVELARYDPRYSTTKIIDKTLKTCERK